MKKTLKISPVLLFLLFSTLVFSADRKKENPSELAETEIGDIVSDAVRTAMKADVAVVAASSIGMENFPDEATEDNVSEIIPFGNEAVVVIELKGAALREALERSVSFLPKRFSGFLQVSGVGLTCDLGAKSGARVSDITVGGRPLDDKKTYTVALSEYLAGGGNGYKSFRDGELVEEEGVPLGEIVLNHARRPGKDGFPTRIDIIVPED